MKRAPDRTASIHEESRMIKLSDAAVIDGESRITLDHGGELRAGAEVLLFDLP